MGIELRTLNEVMSWAKFLKGLGLVTEDEFTVREYLDASGRSGPPNDMKRNMIFDHAKSLSVKYPTAFLAWRTRERLALPRADHWSNLVQHLGEQ